MTIYRLKRFFLPGLICAWMGVAEAQTIADGVDNPVGTTFTTSAADRDTDEDYPAGVWVFDTTTTFDGVDSVRTTLPDQKYSILDAEVQGPATLSFRWKCSVQEYFDRLGFVSASSKFSVHGEQDWQQRTVTLDCGTNDVRWYLDRNGTIPTAEMSAWIDDIVVTPIPRTTDAEEGMDYTGAEVFSDDWGIELDAMSVGGDHARSGDIMDGQTSSLMMEIEGPAKVEFSWGLDGEDQAYSEIGLFIDGSRSGTLSDTASMAERSLDLGPGSHCLKFQYYQDYPFDSENPYVGTKAAYLDNFRVTQITESPALATAVERPDGVYSNDWEFQIFESQVGSSAAGVSATETNSVKFLYVDLPDESGLLSFWVKTKTDLDEGFLFVDVDGESIVEQSGDVDWRKIELNLGEGSDRTLEAAFVRYTDVDAGSIFTSAYLDGITFFPGETNYQPDLAIKAQGSGYKGNNRYNRSGGGQIAKRRTDDRRPYGIYKVDFGNDSPNYRDTISIRGSRSNRHFRTFFLLREGKSAYNFTSAFVTGRLQTTELNPGAEETFELQIGRKRRSLKKTRTIIVVGTSQSDASKVDVVKAKLKVKPFRFRR